MIGAAGTCQTQCFPLYLTNFNRYLTADGMTYHTNTSAVSRNIEHRRNPCVIARTFDHHIRSTAVCQCKDLFFTSDLLIHRNRAFRGV